MEMWRSAPGHASNVPGYPTRAGLAPIGLAKSEKTTRLHRLSITPLWFNLYTQAKPRLGWAVCFQRDLGCHGECRGIKGPQKLSRHRCALGSLLTQQALQMAIFQEIGCNRIGAA